MGGGVDVRAMVQTRARTARPVEPERAPPDWDRLAEAPEFLRLERLRRRVVATMLSVFALAFGVFLILCAYARPFMRRSVDGGLTVAYAWLLSLTLLAWVLVWAYLRFAEKRLGPLARNVVEQESAARDGRP